ncbi:MAG: DUF192 domain-containing protein [Rhodobacteraceae bacterium]|nr:DUF192 domain-containing protein [Paracoccaceae bacterium]
MLRAAIWAVSLVWAGASGAMAACAEDRVQVRGDWGSARFTVEIADTPEERALGLMHRETMPMRAGMLFIYPRERPLAFWMQNTLIPLDIIYFDATGQWVSIVAEAQPLDETPRPSEGPAQYVLEINGGLAEQFGMGPGTVLRHPRIPQDIAAWPCDEG